MAPSRLVLGPLFSVGVAIVGTHVDDSTDSERPDVERDAETDDGEILLVHRGGEDVPRDALVLVIRANGSADEQIIDLASADHPRIIHPFSDETGTRGGSLRVAAPADRSTTVVLQ